MRFHFDSPLEGEIVHHPDRVRWTEESFLDVPGTDENGPSRFLGVFQSGRRMQFFLICIVAVIVLFSGRIFYLQIIQGNYFAALAEGNRIRIVTERATRGIIVDAKQRPLVSNAPEFIVTLTPFELPQNIVLRQAIITRVASLLRESPLAIIEGISALSQNPQTRRQALPFRDQIIYEDAVRFMVEEDRLPGFHVVLREKRDYPATYTGDTEVYPMPESIGHVIGYLGKINGDELPARQQQGYLASDLVGKDGIERFYETVLHGKHGKRFIEIDALGNEKVLVRREEPEMGKRLILSLDLDLQRVLEDSLQHQIDSLPKRDRKGAAAIAIDPRDGSIRALVSLPAYQPKTFSGKLTQEDSTRLFTDPSQPLFPRAISGEYPSGSTIKPLVALAALEEKVITPSTTVLSQGGIAVGQWFFPDWKQGGHGLTDVRKAIAESVNTFFYTIGGGHGSIQGLGIDRLTAWMRKFRLGERLGIDLPHEATGLVPTPTWKKEKRGEIWYIGDTYHVSIGQGDIMVTPLQIAEMTMFFANGGTLWQPKLLSDKAPYALVSGIASANNIQVIREGMRRTITAGSAQRLSTLPVAVAGKTGTAEWSTKRPPHAWFTGFAPYDNPELVVTVMIEEGVEGSSTAVPVAAEAFREYFKGK
ncbi:MAG: penicillin-binding protein 2 [bacterium]|nr:penicillin-binding protein 2 [bacterium]